MGDQIQSTYKKDGVTKEGVPYKKGDGRVDNKGEPVREYTRRPDIPFVLASNDKRQAIVDAYETAVSRVESGAKTSSYSGSFESAGQRVYDPRTTNDLWVFRGFNLTPKGRLQRGERRRGVPRGGGDPQRDRCREGTAWAQRPGRDVGDLQEPSGSRPPTSCPTTSAGPSV